MITWDARKLAEALLASRPKRTLTGLHEWQNKVRVRGIQFDGNVQIPAAPDDKANPSWEMVEVRLAYTDAGEPYVLHLRHPPTPLDAYPTA